MNHLEAAVARANRNLALGFAATIAFMAAICVFALMMGW